MKRLPAAALVVLVCLSRSLFGAEPLPRSDPEAQGVSSAGLLAFVEALDKVDVMNSVMVVRHGHVVAEGWWTPYEADAPHQLFSLSKSFTSTAVGLAVAEGKLSVDDEVLKFFPEDAPKDPANNLKSMRVSDLLRMSTGHQQEPARTNGEPWTRSFLAQPVPFKPGTHFLYNTSATYVLSAIVQKATGQTVLDYLKPRLFEPLGIENPTWEASPQGISAGGFGLNVRTEDIAKFGQLYLQKGKWNGRQLVPEAWVAAATARQTSNGSNPKSDWDQGYGYQFWRCTHNAFRGDGAFGQYCVVMPEQDAVLVITSGVKNMQAVLDLAWEHLLPAMKPSPAATQADAEGAKRLAQRLKGLKVPTVDGSASPAANVWGKKFVIESNPRKLESIVLERDGEGAVTMVTTTDGVTSRVNVGRGEWRRGRMARGRTPEQAVAASGGWTDGNTFTAKLCFYETPFVSTLRFKFAGDEVRVTSETNVGFGQTREAELTGKAGS